ncbi:MAG TPA: hypothetical protein DCQ20_02085 [Nitrospira sp.]|nr:hypothetical protein [Nitrospira sp.]
MSRGLYFWVGARELLPSAWRWLTAVVRQSNAVGDNAVSVVAQAALQRVSRALQVRDALHLALNRPQTNDTADDVASLFEMVAMLYKRQVDATARVAHEVLALGDSRHRAGWQNPAWLSKVKGQSPELKELFPAVGNTTDALTILRACRNTVHAEGIRQLIMSSAATRDRTMIELPKDKASDLEAAFERLGGKARWGIEPVFQESLHADPGILAEQLLLHILGMLNRIMDTTPVERFEHANLQEVDSLPPECESFDTFGEMTRNSIRWQLGL